MKKALIALLFANSLFAGIQVIPVLGPADFNNTAAYQSFIANAINQMHNFNGADAGNFSTSPDAFNQVTVILPQDMLATSTFNSWRGVIAPTGNAAFDNEYGTFLYFVFRISNVGDFAMDDVQIGQIFSDPALSAFNVPLSLGNFPSTYDATHVGYNSGVALPSGTASSVRVDELIGITSVFFPFEAFGEPNTQQGLDNVIALLAALNTYTITTTVALETVNGTAGVVTVLGVPEPATMAFTGLGLIALGLVARRRKA